MPIGRRLDNSTLGMLAVALAAGAIASAASAQAAETPKSPYIIGCDGKVTNPSPIVLSEGNKGFVTFRLSPGSPWTKLTSFRAPNQAREEISKGDLTAQDKLIPIVLKQPALDGYLTFWIEGVMQTKKTTKEFDIPLGSVSVADPPRPEVTALGILSPGLEVAIRKATRDSDEHHVAVIAFDEKGGQAWYNPDTLDQSDRIKILVEQRGGWAYAVTAEGSHGNIPFQGSGATPQLPSEPKPAAGSTGATSPQSVAAAAVAEYAPSRAEELLPSISDPERRKSRARVLKEKKKEATPIGSRLSPETIDAIEAVALMPDATPDAFYRRLEALERARAKEESSDVRRSVQTVISSIESQLTTSIYEYPTAPFLSDVVISVSVTDPGRLIDGKPALVGGNKQKYPVAKAYSYSTRFAGFYSSLARKTFDTATFREKDSGSNFGFGASMTFYRRRGGQNLLELPEGLGQRLNPVIGLGFDRPRENWFAGYSLMAARGLDVMAGLNIRKIDELDGSGKATHERWRTRPYIGLSVDTEVFTNVIKAVFSPGGSK